MTGTDPWRERGLRDAALSGDRSAWRELFQAGRGPLEAYVRWRCGGRSDWADDAVQEAWMIAVDRLRSFDPTRGEFAQWLRGIAANVIRNMLRKRRSRLSHQEPPSANGCATSPAREAERVALTLAELPDRYEAVLRGKYLDGLTVAEIAERNGESEKAIESLLTRARQAFRTAYESEV